MNTETATAVAMDQVTGGPGLEGTQNGSANPSPSAFAPGTPVEILSAIHAPVHAARDAASAPPGNDGPLLARKPEVMQMSNVLAKLVVLPEDQQIQLMTLEFNIEQALHKGWTAFVEIGEALIEIKEKKLYVANGMRFEDYCAAKWGIRHSHTNNLMAAAQFLKSLAAVPNVPKPERESIVRPLLKLTTENAQRAWTRAVELAKGNEITARLVRNVVRAQNPENSGTAESRKQRAKSVSRRAQITAGFGELLRLVAERADYAVITDRIEALYTQCRCLLSPIDKKRRDASSAT
jgi:hypothetical protein